MTTVPAERTFGTRCAALAADIKISHTIFAMPFALLSTFMAAGGWPSAWIILLIVICMISARTVAMAANRLLDAKLDALNPRTARRAIPSGRLSQTFVIGAMVAMSLLFISATAMFLHWFGNPWPLMLSVPVLLFLCAYPLFKRFTRFCHYYLGAALALAPICAWVAVSGSLAWEPVLMAAAVLLWTAGFDIIYACQDHQSDLETGIFSVPSCMGIRRALILARITHVGSVAMLIMLGWVSPLLGPIWFAAVGGVVVMLVIEHSLVRADDLSKVNLSFFTINGLISLTVGFTGIIDTLLK